MSISKFTHYKLSLYSLIILITFLFLSQPINAMPMSPELVEQLRETGELQKFISRMTTAKANGVCQPFEHDHGKAKTDFSLDANAIDTFRVIVILADFSDETAVSGGVSASVADFEHLLFSTDSTDNHYSMSEFYYENSYGNFILEGTVVGWYRLPQTYAYYVDGQNGFGSYPTNAQRMAQDAVLAADPDVDYSDFDNDNNGTVDGVFIVHAGPGAESTGSDFDIWSHAWGFPTVNLDGINISSYTTEPEELYGGLITQGVFSHEYGHFLGLPDLYDTDYSSSGLGRWSLMAGGSWNNSGAYPAFLDAWCKKELGFINPVNVTSNLINEEIASSYYNSVAYRMWENGNVGQEYFLIENRQKVKNDKGIPGSGLLIYHIDESQWGNSDETHYLVAIEQADNLYQLENDVNSGDQGDVWSTSTQTEFSDASAPNSKKYDGSATNILVWNISNADSLMYANLDLNFSAPLFSVTSTEFSDSLFGNNNGFAEVGESISFTFTLNNSWGTADNVTGTLTSANPDFVFSTSSVNIGTVLGGGGTGSNISIPLVFDIPVTYDPCLDSFFLSITSDNAFGDITVGLELQVGTAEILIVDDDNGDIWEQPISTTLRNFRQTHDIYDKSIMGAPSGSLLNEYNVVIWITGSDRADIFSSADYTAMQTYMDAGGNLMLSGQSVVQELSIDDQTFLHNYFKADYDTDLFYAEMIGIPGTEFGDGLRLGFDNRTNQTSPELMTLFGLDGVAELELPAGGIVGVSYVGAYRSLLLSFGIEGISSRYELDGYTTLDSVFSKVLRFFDYGDVNTFSNPMVDSIMLPNEFSPDAVVSTNPIFSWNYVDTTGSSQLQYQIQVGSGNLCINSNDMWDSGLLSGAVDSIEYNGAILEEGGTYYVRIRAYNGTDWSSWRRTTFTMNFAPLSGAIISPINDIQLLTNTPELVVNNGSDGNGDLLTYSFEVYSDDLLTNLITSTSSVAEGVGVTSWTVNVPLAEDGHYYWRSRPSDGAVNGDYSTVGSFYVNEVNQGPSSFSLLAPADSVESVGVTPTLVWSASFDNDPGDMLEYSLVYDDDALFNSPVTVITGGDSSFTIGSPLADNSVYYWKVVAYDLANDSTWSTETFLFNTGPWNTAPQGGAIVSPLNDIHITTSTPTLVVNNGSDINGDVLTYDFEVYSDEFLTSLVASTSLIPEGIGTTSWTVDVSLPEDGHYYWRSRAHDGSLYGTYSSVGSFYVNQSNQAPALFSLSSPLNASELVGINPIFYWNVSTDADAGDSVIYSLVYSDDSLFGSQITQATGKDSSFTVVTPLVLDVIYYWKVFATDIAEDTTWSTETFSFNTGKVGCCDNFRGNVDFDQEDIIDISDLVYLVDFMFTQGPDPECEDEANVDGLGVIDISDLVMLVDFMFTSGTQPPDCP